MTDTNQALQDAFSFIEEGQFEAARQVLTPLLQQNPDNPDVWWVYAHAVEDPEAGKQALRKVMELRPDYPGATALMSLVDSDLEGSVSTSQPTPTDSPSSTPEEVAQAGGSSPLRLLAFAAIVVLIVVAGFLILSNMGQGEDEIDTTQVAQATASAEGAVVIPEVTVTTSSATDEAAMTDEVAETMTSTDEAVMMPTEAEQVDEETPSITEEPTATEVIEATSTPAEAETLDGTATLEPEGSEIDRSDLESAIVAVVETSETVLSQRTTELGDTLVVRACSIPGPAASATISEVMSVLVEQVDQIDTEAVAVDVTDCEASVSLRVVGVSSSALRDLASGDIDQAAFRTQWQPVD